MNTDKEPRRMSFYATPADQKTIQAIKELRPYYSFNFAVREGLGMLLRSLQQQDQVTPRPGRLVEYNLTPT